MTSEIGSEFHKMPCEEGYGLALPRPGTLVFSGRTAIEAVLRQIPDAHTALLPSYCCDSMIAPFRDAGIKVKFYQVDWDNGLKIEINESADIFLWCNYFGFKNEMPELNGIVIEDITHSMLLRTSSHQRSDYLVASLRKWEPIICGGYCSVQIDGKNPSDEFVRLKLAAMELKKDYLEDLDMRKKTQFLSMFYESNRWLSEHYSGLYIDSFSHDFLGKIDVAQQRKIRRENANALYEGLNGIVQFMVPVENMECPLFVPILIPNRDAVRAHLIENDIYCPVHWPKPDGCKSNIYDLELSLICDQRYGINEMKRIVSVIQEVL